MFKKFKKKLFKNFLLSFFVSSMSIMTMSFQSLTTNNFFQRATTNDFNDKELIQLNVPNNTVWTGFDKRDSQIAFVYDDGMWIYRKEWGNWQPKALLDSSYHFSGEKFVENIVINSLNDIYVSFKWNELFFLDYKEGIRNWDTWSIPNDVHEYNYVRDIFITNDDTVFFRRDFGLYSIAPGGRQVSSISLPLVDDLTYQDFVDMTYNKLTDQVFIFIRNKGFFVSNWSSGFLNYQDYSNSLDFHTIDVLGNGDFIFGYYDFNYTNYFIWNFVEDKLIEQEEIKTKKGFRAFEYDVFGKSYSYFDINNYTAGVNPYLNDDNTLFVYNGINWVEDESINANINPTVVVQNIAFEMENQIEKIHFFTTSQVQNSLPTNWSIYSLDGQALTQQSLNWKHDASIVWNEINQILSASQPYASAKEVQNILHMQENQTIILNFIDKPEYVKKIIFDVEQDQRNFLISTRVTPTNGIFFTNKLAPLDAFDFDIWLNVTWINHDSIKQAYQTILEFHYKKTLVEVTEIFKEPEIQKELIRLTIEPNVIEHIDFELNLKEGNNNIVSISTNIIPKEGFYCINSLEVINNLNFGVKRPSANGQIEPWTIILICFVILTIISFSTFFAFEFKKKRMLKNNSKK